ncbi:MAG TPA: acyl--CoA ligase [Myxococcales bacterium]|nr:acyl--CoA ligase [Myxococcales bacterium]
MRTLVDLLHGGAAAASAIRSVEGAPPLAYGELRALAEQTIRDLNALGIGRGDRVAMVLPNGPTAASAFLCVAAGATAAPLSPGLTAEELEFNFGDLRAKALLVAPGSAPEAREVAARLGLGIVELVPQAERGAGSFSLDALAPAAPGPCLPGPAGEDDVALVLHTSGSTAQPKIVPLLQRNLCASARHIVAALGLGPEDVGLNLMPLFHIHGLMAGLLAPLSAGAQVACAPGFNGLKVFEWLDQVRPTWYTAVPTMHQAILARAPRHRPQIERARLRLVRSSSASLAPQVMQELEETFRCPVIEAYGMTEAAHQMASNPLPPLARKPGSVGLPAGPEMAVMDERGSILAQGQVGEVVVRGPNLTPGYEANPEANAAAFHGGWFRTGDQGVIGEDGYLRLTGRLKELINRGGEKIAPIEIDVVLMDHPAVQRCVTFAMPHDKLGEEVAAAVVLREGNSCTERQLRDFAAGRLADHKVPRHFVFVRDLPQGRTGKLQRIGLARKLGLIG